MILDTLDKLEKYGFISPLMDKVADFFKNTDLASLEPGRIVLQGDDLFVNINRQDAQTRDEVPIEAHKEYIDIQFRRRALPVEDLSEAAKRVLAASRTCLKR